MREIFPDRKGREEGSHIKGVCGGENLANIGWQDSQESHPFLCPGFLSSAKKHFSP